MNFLTPSYSRLLSRKAGHHCTSLHWMETSKLGDEMEIQHLRFPTFYLLRSGNWYLLTLQQKKVQQQLKLDNEVWCPSFHFFLGGGGGVEVQKHGHSSQTLTLPREFWELPRHPPEIATWNKKVSRDRRLITLNPYYCWSIFSGGIVPIRMNFVGGLPVGFVKIPLEFLLIWTADGSGEGNWFAGE